MPFTLAHPAIVLPFKYLHRWNLSMTALVTGSMIPDFEYFIRMRDIGIYGHNWPGLFWFDLPLGLIVYFLYQYFVKDKLIDHLPPFFNKRFSGFKGAEFNNVKVREAMIIIVSIIIGTATHLLWDGFTHRRGDFVQLIPALRARHGYWNHMYDYLQYLSSIIGLGIMVVVVLFLPGKQVTSVRALYILFHWLVVAIAAAAVFAIRSRSGFGVWPYGNILICLISGTMIGLILASILINARSAPAK